MSKEAGIFTSARKWEAFALLAATLALGGRQTVLAQTAPTPTDSGVCDTPDPGAPGTMLTNYEDELWGEMQLNSLDGTYEHGGFFADPNRIVFSSVGKQSELDPPMPYQENYPLQGIVNIIITHNHPELHTGGQYSYNALSPQDVIYAAFINAKEIRAVSIDMETGERTLSRAWLESDMRYWTLGSVDSGAAIKKFNTILNQQLSETTGDWYQLNQKAWTEALKEWAKVYGICTEFTKLPPLSLSQIANGQFYLMPNVF